MERAGVGQGRTETLASGNWWIGLARLSPDGRQVAYTSAETGSNEVYVGPFPEAGVGVQVSTNGGSEPVWARDGNRLFYVAGRRMMSATLAPLPNVRVLAHDSLFVGDGFGDLSSATYDVASDEKRFLMLRTDDRRVQLVVALNWAAGIAARVKGR